MKNREYKINSFYNCIDDYKIPDNIGEWQTCPYCKLKPRIWEFDNGRFTVCGCWNDTYQHFIVSAESIMSVVKNSHNGTSCADYDEDELRKNWNHYCETDEILFDKSEEYKNNHKW